MHSTQASSLDGQASRYPRSPFKEGDLVMFRNRCQLTAGGMRVQEVDINMFDVRLRVGDRWWVPENFISLEQWRQQMAMH